MMDLMSRPSPRVGSWSYVLAVLTVALAGCSSGGDSADTSPEVTTTTSSAPSVTSGPDIVESPTLDQADIDAVTLAFETFFGGQGSTVDEKVGVLENGEFYRDMLEDASSNEQFQMMTTDIREVRYGSEDECDALGAEPGCAVVLHDLLVDGFPMAAAIESPAVSRGGVWLVGARAWCNVVEIGGASCPEAP